MLFTKHGTGHTIRLPPRREIQSNRDKRNPSSLSLSLSARHCFSERLIKVRKYGLEGREREFGRALPPFELMTGDTVRVPGLEGGEGSCGIAAENRRSIVPAVNKSLMIPRQALPRPPRRPTTTNYTKRRDDGGIL